MPAGQDIIGAIMSRMQRESLEDLFREFPEIQPEEEKAAELSENESFSVPGVLSEESETDLPLTVEAALSPLVNSEHPHYLRYDYARLQILLTASLDNRIIRLHTVRLALLLTTLLFLVELNRPESVTTALWAYWTFQVFLIGVESMLDLELRLPFSRQVPFALDVIFPGAERSRQERKQHAEESFPPALLLAEDYSFPVVSEKVRQHIYHEEKQKLKKKMKLR